MLKLVYKRDTDKVKPQTKAQRYSYQFSEAEILRMMKEVVMKTNLKNSKKDL